MLQFRCNAKIVCAVFLAITICCHVLPIDVLGQEEASNTTSNTTTPLPLGIEVRPDDSPSMFERIMRRLEAIPGQLMSMTNSTYNIVEGVMDGDMQALTVQEQLDIRNWMIENFLEVFGMFGGDVQALDWEIVNVTAETAATAAADVNGTENPVAPNLNQRMLPLSMVNENYTNEQMISLATVNQNYTIDNVDVDTNNVTTGGSFDNIDTNTNGGT